MHNFIISNPRLIMHIELHNGLFVRNFYCPSTTVPYSYQDDGELFTLTYDSKILHTCDFVCTAQTHFQDSTEELLTFHLQNPELGINLRVCILNNLTDTISVIYQLADLAHDDFRKNYYFHSPFLANMHLDSTGKEKIYYPGNPYSRTDGKSAVQLSPLTALPYVLTDSMDKNGFSVTFPTLSDHEASAQNRNLDFQKISSKDELANHSFLIRPGKILTDIAEFSICGLENGWREAFSRIRDSFRMNTDFREYEKPALSWFQDTLLHHFTFLYSKEAYNYETNTVDIDRLASDGQEFGGYDTITLWHQYPRLGVDRRTQWDFFHDFPNSIQGIRKAIQTAHDYGIKVFLPYKPWDISDHQSMDQVCDEIKQLISDTDTDGFFLDTMDQAPKKFRQAANEVKPEIIFCSEGHPSTRDSLHLLTASWNQYWTFSAMPEMDLLRFLLPEHTAPQISRWQAGPQKDDTINRAIFSGTGIVIWQDVFGTWLPYTNLQKDKIRKYKEVWTKYKTYFQGFNPIPLYPTEFQNLYCNCFTDNNNSGVVFSFYNDTTENISGLLAYNHTNYYHNATCILGDTELYLSANEIHGTIPPKSAILFFIDNNTH